MKSKIYKKIVYALAKIAVKRMSNRTAEYQPEEKADDNSEIIDLNTDESMDCINSIDRIDGEKAEGDTAINEEKTVEPTGEERLDMLLRGITVDQQTEIMQQEITGKQTESIQQVDSIQQTDDDKKPDSLQEKQEPEEVSENKACDIKDEAESDTMAIMSDDVNKYSEELGIKELRQELRRVKYNTKFAATLFNTVGTLVVVAALAILVANLWLPILQVTGTSMSPTLEEGQILMASKGSDFKTGDVVAFYYNNKILVKRVIAMPGDWVNISDDGTVYVNDIAIDEPYLKEKAFGDCNIELPYQVPESKIFVMGDNRSVSLDSRNTAIGCISEEQVVGKVTFGLWPLNSFGKI